MQLIITIFLILALSFPLTACTGRPPKVQVLDLPEVPIVTEPRQLTSGRSGTLTEVAPPAVIIDLDELIAEQTPSLRITSPRAEQVIDDTRFTAKIQLRGLSIYKENNTGLGPHVQVSLDNQPARSIYSLDDPIEFTDLEPGTHTLRAIALKPWGESYKNDEAFAETTFHLFAPTQANAPNPNQPELIYSQPQGTYTAEPILLDFQLNNAPLHLLTDQDETLPNWQIRCDINGQSFTFDQWHPIYLRGFKPGQNWVRLTLVDEDGRAIDNAFNSTVRLINYAPKQIDSLGQLMRGELPIREVGTIVDPNYVPPAIPEPVITQPEPEDVDISDVDTPDADISDVDTSTNVKTEIPASESVPESVDSVTQGTEEAETSAIKEVPVDLKEMPLLVPEESAVRDSDTKNSFLSGERASEESVKTDLEPENVSAEQAASDEEEGSKERKFEENDLEVGDRAINEDRSNIAPEPSADSAATELPTRPSFFNRIQNLFNPAKSQGIDEGSPATEQQEPEEEINVEIEERSERFEPDVEERLDGPLEDNFEPNKSNIDASSSTEIETEESTAEELSPINPFLNQPIETDPDSESLPEAPVLETSPGIEDISPAIEDAERTSSENPFDSELEELRDPQKSTVETVDRTTESSDRPSFFQKIQNAFKQPNKLPTTTIKDKENVQTNEESERIESERIEPERIKPEANLLLENDADTYEAEDKTTEQTLDNSEVSETIESNEAKPDEAEPATKAEEFSAELPNDTEM